MVLVAAEIVERRRGAALADGLAEIAVEVESTADALGGEVRPCEAALRPPDLDDTELGLLAELRRDRSRKRPRNPKPAAVEKLRAEDAADVLRQARARVDERLSFQRPAEHPAETPPTIRITALDARKTRMSVIERPSARRGFVRWPA